jgi:hypothetical protein
MVSRRFISVASALLAALPSTIAQAAPAVTVNTGAAVAAAATPAAVAGTTYSMAVAGVGNASATGASTPASSGVTGTTKVWPIKVGGANGSLSFSPNTISGAQVGDMLQFQFYPNVCNPS